MIRHILAGTVSAIALAAMLTGPALADNYDAIDSHHTQITFGAKSVSGVLHPYHVLEGLNGATPTPLQTNATGLLMQGSGVSGTPAGGVLSVQGVTSMTPFKVDGSGFTQPVSGAFWQATQPVSLATAPALVAGAAIIGKVGIDQTTPGTTDHVTAAQTGTWNLGNITGTVNLPTGASTSAKQPALGTAGTPSADVLTIQGATSMTAVKVDGSAVTQPANVTQIAGSSIQAASNSLNSTGTGIAAGAPVLQFDDTSPSAVTENQFAHPRMNSERYQRVQNGVITNPSNNYNRPANTTAYPANGLVANNVSGASVVVPSLTVSTEGFRLATAKIWTNTTSGIDTTVFGLDFWSTAPTFTNGDGSDYKTAFTSTGAGANWLGNMTCNGFRQFTDAAVAECWSSSNFPKALKPGTTIYYTTYDVNAFTPQSGKNFAVSVSAEND